MYQCRHIITNINSINSRRNFNKNNKKLSELGVKNDQNDIGFKANHNVKKRRRNSTPNKKENDDEKTMTPTPKPPKKKKQKTNYKKSMEIDHWGTKSNMKMRGRTITAVGGYCHLYGRRRVSSGIFRWRFRINHVSSPRTEIGVVAKDLPINRYSMEVKEGNFFFYGKSSSRRKYGRGCKAGSIIEMILDLDQFKLSYVVDGRDYGKACDVEKGSYRAFVCLVQPEESMTMLSY